MSEQAEAWDTYQTTVQSAREAYDAAVQQATEECDAVVQPAKRAYNVTVRSANESYRATQQQAWKTCEDTLREAWKAYEAAKQRERETCDANIGADPQTDALLRDAALRESLLELLVAREARDGYTYPETDVSRRPEIIQRAYSALAVSPSKAAERVRLERAVVKALGYEGTTAENLRQWAKWSATYLSEVAILPLWLREVAKALDALDAAPQDEQGG